MKQGWEIKMLGEIGTVITGSTPSTKDDSNYSSKDYCFVKPSDISNETISLIRETEAYISEKAYLKSRKLPRGSVLTTCIGIIGKVGILKVDATCNQQINGIIPNENCITPEFLAYSLISRKSYLQGIANAPVVPIINKKEFSDVSIPIPPLPEQEKIVSELDCLSVLIEKKRQQLKELDALAQSIFYEMFGNPVENERGWEVKKLGEEFEISSGGTPDTKNDKYWNEGDISWIGSNMCHNDIIYNNDGKYITNEGLEHSSAKMYNSGYVIVALVGATIGKTALLRFATTTNQNVAGINVPSNTNYTSEYVFYLIQNLYGLFQSIGNGKFKMANLSFVRSLPLLVPPLPLQQTFAQKVEAIEKQKELIKQSIIEAETLLASRMQYYFEEG